ncbi:MAG: electron transfer flavoprotein subunit beta/FixA family protein [Actinomycetes bacterium]
MDVLVCIKRVPMSGGKFVLTDDEQDIDTKRLGFTISPHEECAVEEAVRIVEQHGGSVTVLTLGVPEAEEQIREQMAIGADRGILLETDGAEWDPQATAAAITDAVRNDETSYDLLLFGNESADASGYQVGIRVAHALGLPAVTGIKSLTVTEGAAHCERPTKTGAEAFDVALPAVVTVMEGLNLPRYPSVPGRIRAKKKPIDRSSPQRPGPRLEKRRLVIPPSTGKQVKVLGEGPEAAAQVVEVFKQIGVV